MNRITKNGNAKMFVWNTIGSMCSAVTSFILLIFVTRICGKFEAGVFSLGFANAQLMLTIGRFGMRAYQATDIKSSIKFSTYFMSRMITCLFMLLVGMGYILWSGYTLEKGAIVFFICVIKMTDALEDVFHGLFQQNGRMDIAGELLTVRNVITILSFTIILIISRDLLLTCAVTAFLSLLACVIINLPMARSLTKVCIEFTKSELTLLFRSCLPLFIGSFLSLYIYNVPKYMIDRYLTADIQAYYNILFMPTFSINLLSEFLFKPLLTGLAVKWEQSQSKVFTNYVLRLLAGVLIITVVAVGAGALWGCEILSFIYGVNLLPYRNELILLLCSGGFSACVYLLFNILTAMRQQIHLLYGYTFAAVIISIVTPGMVKGFYMMGASFSCFVSSVILFAIFSLMLLFGIQRKRKMTCIIP